MRPARNQLGLKMRGQRAEDLAPELRDLAARQWHDYWRRISGTYFGEGHGGLNIDAAYAVQREVARLRCEAGDAVAGDDSELVGCQIVWATSVRQRGAVLILSLTACAELEPYEPPITGDIPAGSGPRSGDDGEFVILRR